MSRTKDDKTNNYYYADSNTADPNFTDLTPIGEGVYKNKFGKIVYDTTKVTPPEKDKSINDNWQTAYAKGVPSGTMSADMETMNAVTGGVLNWTMPSQVVGATTRLINDGDFGQFGRNLILGNSGIVTDKFAQEHPWYSMGANLLFDTATLGAAAAGKSGIQSGVNYAKTKALSNGTGLYLDLKTRFTPVNAKKITTFNKNGFLSKTKNVDPFFIDSPWGEGMSPNSPNVVNTFPSPYLVDDYFDLGLHLDRVPFDPAKVKPMAQMVYDAGHYSLGEPIQAVFDKRYIPFINEKRLPEVIAETESKVNKNFKKVTDFIKKAELEKGYDVNAAQKELADEVFYNGGLDRDPIIRLTGPNSKYAGIYDSRLNKISLVATDPFSSNILLPIDKFNPIAAHEYQHYVQELNPYYKKMVVYDPSSKYYVTNPKNKSARTTFFYLDNTENPWTRSPHEVQSEIARYKYMYNNPRPVSEWPRKQQQDLFDFVGYQFNIDKYNAKRMVKAMGVAGYAEGGQLKNQKALGGNLFRNGSWMPNKQWQNRISAREGSSMYRPASDTGRVNSSFQAEASRFLSVLPKKSITEIT